MMSAKTNVGLHLQNRPAVFGKLARVTTSRVRRTRVREKAIFASREKVATPTEARNLTFMVSALNCVTKNGVRKWNF
jgi:hypothetical protein